MLRFTHVGAWSCSLILLSCTPSAENSDMLWFESFYWFLLWFLWYLESLWLSLLISNLNIFSYSDSMLLRLDCFQWWQTLRGSSSYGFPHFSDGKRTLKDSIQFLWGLNTQSFSDINTSEYFTFGNLFLEQWFLSLIMYKNH